jgi:predicted AlkP superfamily phosphohydrolase/phosphomutase
MAAGVLPNFTKAVSQGDYKPLQTTRVPQSPVAWSTFITGMDPGGHGIYDFVHRNPKTTPPIPYFSMTKASQATRKLAFGSWVLPLSRGKVELLRKGRAFWQVLGESGIPTTIYRMPVNFPPVDAPDNKTISGMGTPDITGTPGTFSYYTDELPDNHKAFTGGKAYEVSVRDNRVEARLYGPENPFRRFKKKKLKYRKSRNPESIKYENPKCSMDFTVDIDFEANAAKFVVDKQEFVLKEKEWTDWISVDFQAVPWLVKISSIARFYLKEIQPNFKLYVTPLQINPADPAMPISNPSDYSEDLCRCVGYWYTQELPEDTKALTYGVLSGQEFWDQSMFVYEERVRALKHLLDKFEDGLLFMYFMTVDQGSHMLWRYMDKQHPGFIPHDFLINGIQKIYEKMDAVVGYVLETIDEDTTLIIMSDHGFAPFYWSVNLNTWLLEKGYITLLNPSEQGQHKLFMNVDWQETTAYAMGLQGVYVNLRGREKNGIVSPGDQYEKLLDRLEADLLAMKDTRNGQGPISLVTRARRDFHGLFKDSGPDLIVGFSNGYRNSWKSPLGELPKEVFIDNLDAWSGDHCIDHRIVPGVLIANREITLKSPALYDLTVGVLDEFGVEPLPEMIGRDCLGQPTKKRNTSE